MWVWAVSGRRRKLGHAAKDGCECGAHGCNGADGPEQIEDKGHDDECEQNADEAVTGRGEFGRSGKAREDHHVKGEGDLQSDVAEVTSSGDPGREHATRR